MFFSELMKDKKHIHFTHSYKVKLCGCWLFKVSRDQWKVVDFSVAQKKAC